MINDYGQRRAADLVRCGAVVTAAWVGRLVPDDINRCHLRLGETLAADAHRTKSVGGLFVYFWYEYGERIIASMYR